MVNWNVKAENVDEFLKTPEQIYNIVDDEKLAIYYQFGINKTQHEENVLIVREAYPDKQSTLSHNFNVGALVMNANKLSIKNKSYIFLFGNFKEVFILGNMMRLFYHPEQFVLKKGSFITNQSKEHGYDNHITIVNCTNISPQKVSLNYIFKGRQNIIAQEYKNNEDLNLLYFGYGQKLKDKNYYCTREGYKDGSSAIIAHKLFKSHDEKMTDPQHFNRFGLIMGPKDEIDKISNEEELRF